MTHGGNKHTARATKLHTIAEPSGSALRKLQEEEEKAKENRSVFEGMDQSVIAATAAAETDAGASHPGAVLAAGGIVRTVRAASAATASDSRLHRSS